MQGEDVVVCLTEARIEHLPDIVEQIMRRGNGGSILEKKCIYFFIQRSIESVGPLKALYINVVLP